MIEVLQWAALAVLPWVAAGMQERVEVRAMRPEPDDVIAFGTTIDASEADRRAVDLADLLRRVPGARVRDYGGLGSYATVSLRASTSEQVTVLVDGVPQNRALGGPVDLSWIPATQLSEVTVFRGFAPAGLGNAGIGGVVDVRTRGPGDESGGQVDLIAGGLESARLSTGWSVRSGGAGSVRIGAEALSSRGNFLWLDTRGTPFTTDDDVVRERENNDVEQTSLLVQGAWTDVGPGSLRAGARVQRRERGVPGIGGSTSAVARLDESLDDVNVSWSARPRHGPRSVDLLLDLFRQEARFTDPEGDVGLRGRQDETTRLHGGGLAASTTLPTGRHRLLLRADLRLEQARVRDDALEVADRGGMRRRLLTLTAEQRLSLGRWTLAPSLTWIRRNDDYLPAGDSLLPPPAADVDDDALTGMLGASFAAAPRTVLRGSLGRFHRNPNLLELFGDRGSVRGNPGLAPERGTAAELGVVQSFAAGVELEIVGFARDTEDLILLWPTNLSTSVARNLGSASVRGLEGSVAARLPWGFRLDASGTLQVTEDTSGGPGDGNRLVYHPERLGYLGLDWRKSGWGARWEVTYVGENSTDALDTPVWRMPSRIVHDLSAGYTARSGWRVGFDVRNLFDRRVRDVARFPLPDRVVFLHVGWRN